MGVLYTCVSNEASPLVFLPICVLRMRLSRVERKVHLSQLHELYEHLKENHCHQHQLDHCPMALLGLLLHRGLGNRTNISEHGQPSHLQKHLVKIAIKKWAMTFLNRVQMRITDRFQSEFKKKKREAPLIDRNVYVTVPPFELWNQPVKSSHGCSDHWIGGIPPGKIAFKPDKSANCCSEREGGLFRILHGEISVPIDSGLKSDDLLSSVSVTCSQKEQLEEPLARIQPSHGPRTIAWSHR